MSRGQDAATEERLNKLSGRLDTLVEGQEAMRRQIDALAKAIDNVREQASKPTGNYASQEDLKRLHDALKEIDRKRLEDNEKIRTELLKLGESLKATPSRSTRKTSPP